LRELANAYAAENVRLSEKERELSIKKFCLKEGKERLKAMGKDQNRNVQSLIGLVAEHKEVLKEISNILRQGIMADLMKLVYKADKDESGEFDDAEIKRLVRYIKGLPSVTVNERRLTKAIKKKRSIQTVMELIHDIARDDIPMKERIFILYEEAQPPRTEKKPSNTTRSKASTVTKTRTLSPQPKKKKPQTDLSSTSLSPKSKKKKPQIDLSSTALSPKRKEKKPQTDLSSTSLSPKPKKKKPQTDLSGTSEDTSEAFSEIISSSRSLSPVREKRKSSKKAVKTEGVSSKKPKSKKTMTVSEQSEDPAKSPAPKTKKKKVTQAPADDGAKTSPKKPSSTKKLQKAPGA
jgi:hypothetical protein